MAYTTIKKPSDYFNTKLYTGNGSNGNAITGVGFQPDFVWIKNRDVTYWHQLYDAVRGVSAGTLYSNQTGAEDFGSGTLLASFDSDGFTVNSNDGCNGNGENLVSWNWLASNTTASNTDGSINSTVSANTTSGFSIVSYTGTGSAGTVGHGLGSAPSVILTKTRSDAEEWFCHWSVLGTGSFVKLSSNVAAGTNATAFPWNPQTDTFGLSSDGATNTNGRTYIAYCFAEKKGFSKFGSYVGNGNADGTFVYTGFKPAFVMIKVSSTLNDWSMYDNKRDTINQVDNYLQSNTSSIEVSDTGKGTDFLSNGFKLRTTHGTHNTSGETYIYMAFAEEPLVGDNPATAR
jgi:hypothetical protein